MTKISTDKSFTRHYLVQIRIIQHRKLLGAQEVICTQELPLDHFNSHSFWFNQVRLVRQEIAGITT